MPNESSGSIEWSLPSLIEAWERDGYESLWLWLDCDLDLDTAADALWGALVAANLADLAAHGAESTPEIGGSHVSVSARGPVAHIDFCDTPEALTAWVGWLVEDLQDRGVSGRLVPVRFRDTPFPDGPVRDVLTAALSVPIDWDRVRREHAERGEAVVGWHADPAVSDRLLDLLVPWCLSGGGRVFFNHDLLETPTSGEQVPGLVASGLRLRPPVSVTCIRNPEDFHRLHFDLLGRVLMQRRRTGSGWAEDLASVRALLVALAPVLELGLARRSRAPSLGWPEAINDAPPPIPYGGTGVSTAYLRRHYRHLEAVRTPDAYGLQVLTDAHLANAHDLSGWSVEEVAPGRHLVSAADPAAWFAGDQPDPDTHARARADFGDLLLSDHVIAASPPRPY